MRWLEVNYSNPLKGTVNIPGSKNSSLGLLAACCLCDEPVHLYAIPDIHDIRVVTDILEEIGAVVKRDSQELYIDPSGINCSVIKPEKSSAFRTAYYFIGALLAKHRKISVGYPGGDSFGPRPIDQHIKGLEALGAKFSFYTDHYVVESEKLTGTEIYFDVITSGATLNLILAAVLAEGKTVLYNAARDPEIVDVVLLLNKMGAKISGAGTDNIKIEGVAELKGCTHSVIPDRLIAGTFMMAAGITKGNVTITNVIPEHLEACILKLSEMGMEIDHSYNSINAYTNSALRPTKITTGMYPVLGSDYQQPITALLLKARGRSVVSDKIYPERYNHCKELMKMGADITIKNGTAYVRGNAQLIGTHVYASDIRAGTSLILAGLTAEGTTYITGVEHLERGYEDVVAAFQSVGADIQLCEGDLNEKESEFFTMSRKIVRV